MSVAQDGQVASSRKRPQDRSSRIVAVASRLFAAHGYHQVSMTNIAAEVDLTSGALYRHFHGKQDLLSHCVRNAFQEFLTARQESPRELDPTVQALASVSLERRSLGALWTRELRHVTPDLLDEVRERLAAEVARLATYLVRERDDLDDDDGELLAWAALGVLVSPFNHGVELPVRRFREILATMAKAVCWAKLTSARAVDSDQLASPSAGLPRLSRRETLLSEAVELFNERGYHAVTLEDIGAAAGIAAPSVYRHFTNKQELLSEALSRGSHGLELGMNLAFQQAGDPTDALGAVLRSHVSFAVDHVELMRLARGEGRTLLGKQRQRLSVVRQDYLQDWSHLLTTTRALSGPEALVVVHGVLTVVLTVASIPPLLQRPTLMADVCDIGDALFAVFPPTAGEDAAHPDK